MANAKKVPIRFQYFRSCTFEGNDEEGFNLLPVLEQIARMELKDRQKEPNDVKGRLESIRKFQNYPNIVAVQFMRLDETSDAYKVKPNQAAEHVDLDDDEYLGTSTVALYDSYNDVLMVQANRRGYRAPHMQGYFNVFSEEKCAFVPILSSEDIERKISDGSVSKLELSVLNVEKCFPSNSRCFEKVLDAVRGLGGNSISLSISLGRIKGAKLNGQDVCNLVHDVYENGDFIGKARLYITDDTKAAIYDLFQDSMKDTIEMAIHSRKELAFDELAYAMLNKYLAVKPKFDRRFLNE